MSDEDLPPPPSNSGPSAHLNTLRGTTQVRQANYVSEELETLLDVEPEDDSIQPPEVAISALKHFMGVSNLYARSLPAYPEDEENWPVDQATKAKWMRFKWFSTSDDEANRANIDEVLIYLRGQGATLEPIAATDLAAITDEHLRGAVVKKVEAMMKAVRTRKREQEKLDKGKRKAREGDDIPGGEEGGEDEDGDDEAAKESRRRAIKNSRVQFTLNQRIRKRATSRYADAKYDKAWAIFSVLRVLWKPISCLLLLLHLFNLSFFPPTLNDGQEEGSGETDAMRTALGLLGRSAARAWAKCMQEVARLRVWFSTQARSSW